MRRFDRVPSLQVLAGLLMASEATQLLHSSERSALEPKQEPLHAAEDRPAALLCPLQLAWVTDSRKGAADVGLHRLRLTCGRRLPGRRAGLSRISD